MEFVHQGLVSLCPGLPVVCSSVCVTKLPALNALAAAANGELRRVSEIAGWCYSSNDVVVSRDLFDSVHLGPSGVA